MFHRRLTLLTLSAAAFAVGGCEGDTVTELGAEIALDVCDEQTQEIGNGLVVGTEGCGFDFGQRDITVKVETDLQVANLGNFDLTISDVYFTEDSDPSFEVVVFPTDVAWDGAALPLRIAYRPLLASSHEATLVIVSDAVNTADEGGELRIPIIGLGVDNGVPDIDVSPAECDFGRAAQGSVKNCTLTISNLGTRDLVFDSVELVTNTQPGDEEAEEEVFGFFGRPPAEGDVLVATEGENVAEVAVRFFPQALGSYTGTLVFKSNDPDETEVTVPLRGIGVDPPSCAIKVASVNGFPVTAGAAPTIEPLDDVILTAEESEPSTASGSITSVQWELVEQPGGSTATLADPGAVSTGFRFADVVGVDLAGRYRVRALVVDDLGTESVNECELTFEAIPTDSILAQLSWDTSDYDMDLHLTKQNADGEYCVGAGDPTGIASNFCGDSGDDCYFGNCKATSSNRPDWDDSGDVSEGDPSLDIDDLDGFGPENINIDLAVEGNYLVGVDYYSGSSVVGNTVRIYLYGQLEAEFFKELTNGDYWEVATIHWPDACVEDLSTTAIECE